MKTILLATDGSPSAAKATDVAIELAGALGAALRVICIWRMPVYDYGYVPMQHAPELVDAQRERAAGVARQAVEQAQKAGVVATAEIHEGLPAAEICDAAEEEGVDMIVLGAHGWGAMKRFLIGSVSTAVLHGAHCPVLVVRGEATEPERADAEMAGAGAAR